jgi:DNA mismatch repair protein MutS2
LSEAKKEAKQILEDVNKKIENTIFEIRSAQAEKDKTKELRKNLELFKETTQKSISEQEKDIEQKMEKLRQKQANKQQKKKKSATNEEPIIEEIVEKELEVGDMVRIYGQDSSGIVEEIKNKAALVNFGNVKVQISIDTLEKIKKAQVENTQKTRPTFKSWDTSKTRSDFMFGLDVRGQRTDDALHTVSRYLDEAIVAQASELKILHGTGNGILRQFIRDFLKTVDFVVSVQDEKIEFGGSGITVVKLNYD